MDHPHRHRPRIGIVGATPWLARGLVSALSDDARWTLVPMRTFDSAEAYVLHAHDGDDAAALQAALPPEAPVMWVGIAPSEVSEPSGEAPAQVPQRAARAATQEPARPLAWLPAEAGAEQLRAALAALLAGLSVRDPALPFPSGTAAARSLPDAAEVTEALTTRELEVFELLAKGLSNRDIAGVLGISSHTAKFHVAQILAKVGAATRAEAVALGLRLGLIGL
jgi:DNA-binding CsgD family transcriptional regulator